MYAAAIAAILTGAAPLPRAQAEDATPPGTVGLEQLLRLPPVSRAQALDTTTRYGGADASEWRARFAEARTEIEAAQQALDQAQEQLAKLAGGSGQWQMSAPGLGGAPSTNTQNSPVSFQLHQEIKRQREEIERVERRLQDLKVEAALAGVPEVWTRPADAPNANPASSSAQP